MFDKTDKFENDDEWAGHQDAASAIVQPSNQSIRTFRADKRLYENL